MSSQRPAPRSPDPLVPHPCPDGFRLRLMMFRIGPRVFAADVRDVIRVEGPSSGGATGPAPVTESRLGRPERPARKLVVMGDAGEVSLEVDGIAGFRAPSPDEIRPLAQWAVSWLASSAVRGLVLVDGDPVVLVDLRALVRDRSVDPSIPSNGGHHA